MFVAILDSVGTVVTGALLPLAEQNPVTAVPMVATLMSSDKTPVGDWKKPAAWRHPQSTLLCPQGTNCL